MRIQIIKILSLLFIFHVWIAMSGCSDDKVEGEIFGTEPGIQGVVFNFVGPPGRQEAEGSADGSEARFRLPRGITSDGTYLYVADSDNNSIRRIGILTRVVETIAGTPEAAGVIDDIGAIAQFNKPEYITTDGDNLYVTDSNIVGSGNNTIRKIELASGFFQVTTIAGNAEQSFADPRDGIGREARFSAPRGITTDGTNLYITDGNLIRMVIITTGRVITLAGDVEINDSGNKNGNGSNAMFNNPWDIVVDGNILYVADSFNNVIRRLTLPGDLNQLITDGTFDRSLIIVETIAGDPNNLSPQDGFGTEARFNFPRGLAIFGGFLYIADTGNHTIRRMDLSTEEVITLAGSFGQMGFAVRDEGAVGESARFNSPQGIVVDAKGNNMYVTNTNLNHIVVIR